MNAIPINITSLTLPAAAVCEILTDHLNAHLLRQPHIVTGVECLDESFVITLEPVTTPAADPEPLPPTGHVVYTIAAGPAVSVAQTAPVNGNGHHLEEAAPAPAAEGPKRRLRRLPPAMHAEIIRRGTASESTARIAADLGIDQTTVIRHLRSGAASADTDGGE